MLSNGYICENIFLVKILRCFWKLHVIHLQWLTTVMLQTCHPMFLNNKSWICSDSLHRLGWLIQRKLHMNEKVDRCKKVSSIYLVFRTERSEWHFKNHWFSSPVDWNLMEKPEDELVTWTGNMQVCFFFILMISEQLQVYSVEDREDWWNVYLHRGRDMRWHQLSSQIKMLQWMILDEYQASDCNSKFM